jgi:DNA-binding CsgD family transcriptional regulator
MGLIERDDELAAIGAARSAAAHGTGKVLAVLGPAGIGKTALLDWAAEASEGEVLRATAGELEGAIPFAVVRQLLGGHLRQPDAHSGAHVAHALDALTLQGHEHRLPEVLDGLYWLCADLAEPSPLTLVIDDLHWSDSASLRFLSYLARRIAEVPILAVVASRPPAGGSGAERFLREPGVEVIRPAPLGRDGVAAVVSDRLGAVTEARFHDACHEASAGNPLYLHALLAALERSGISPTSAAITDLEALSPDLVKASVDSRLDGLGADALALARAVAVLGVANELRLAAAMADLPQDGALDARAALRQADLLAAEDPLRFVHPVVRRVVYDVIPDVQRQRAHRRAADLLEDHEEAAVHLLQTEPWDDAAVRDRLQEAADRALERGAADVAVTLLRRAFREGRPTAALVRDLARAEWRAGEPGATMRLRESIALETDPLVARRDQRTLVNWLLTDEDHAAALAVVGDLIADAPDPEDEASLAAHGLAVALDGQAHAATAWARRLDCLPDSVDAVLVMRAWLDAVGGMDEHLAPVEELMDSWMRSGRPLYRLELGTYAACALLLRDRWSTLRRWVDQLVTESRRRSSADGLVIALGIRAKLHVFAGRLRDAEIDAADAFAAASEGRGSVFGPFVASSVLDVGCERLTPAAELTPALLMTEREPAPLYFNLALPLVSRARLELRDGNVTAATASLRKAGRHALSSLAPGPWLPWRSELALALARDGQHAEAKDLVAEELSLAERQGEVRHIAVALRARGILGPDTAALERSVDLLAGGPFALEHARSLVELGAALRRAGERVRSRDPLRACLDLALSAGSALLAGRAREELAASGARLRRERSSGVPSLTASELRVARLAALGRTNREIAEELYVTVKTIEKHMGNVFLKLDVASRRELATALQS